MRIALLLALIASFVTAWMPAKPAETSLAYDVYITVGKGQDGEDGPVGKAEVTLSGPGEKVSPQTKRSDEEGIVKFTVQQNGRYHIDIKCAGFEPYEGRVFVEKSPTYYVAGLLPPKAKPGKARIAVTVKDSESGWPVEGAAIRTQRDDESSADHMKTGSDGREYVVVNLSPATKGGLTFDVTVSHPDYESQTKRVTADKNRTTDYPLEFSLKKAQGLRILSVTCLEAGTRAPIHGATIIADGGRDEYFTQETGPDGKAVLRLPNKATSYDIKVTTRLFEEHTDKVNLAQETGVVKRTYELVKKDSAPVIRRALIVTVQTKDENGAMKPVQDAVVDGPGYHAAATDASGQIVFLHTTPPGENITVTASKLAFKPGSATVLVRDKGVMVDVNAFSKDTAGGMSDLDALRKQRVTGYDTATITLDLDRSLSHKVIGQIEAPNEANPGDPLSYSIRLNYEEGDDDAITVEEVITVTDSSGKIVDRKGNIEALNQGSPSTESYSFTPSKAGIYRIKCVVSRKGGVLWTGEASVEATEDRRKITITGDVVAKKARVNLDERIDVNVNVLYNSGPKEQLNLRERVELFNPKGEISQNNLGERALTRGSYSLRNFAITAQAPGTYRLKSTILGPDGEVLWTGEDRFEVMNKGKAVMQKPGQGYYRLKKKVVGNVPGPAVGQYGTWSGSISESSFTITYEARPPYKGQININIQFSVPPTVIKPNETIELTVQGSASLTGPDIGSSGIGAGWSVTGSGEVVEAQKIFVGRASDGKDYTSGSGKYKIKAGEGRDMVIGNVQGGQTWGGSDNWNPCTYYYEWVPNLAPPDNKTGGKTTMQAGGTTEKRPSPAGSYSGTIQLAKGGVIPHGVTLSISGAANANVFSVTGTVTSKVKGKGYQINLNGTYNPSTNKFSGKGTTGGMDFAFRGSMDGGEPAIIVQIQQGRGKPPVVAASRLKKAG